MKIKITFFIVGLIGLTCHGLTIRAQIFTLKSTDLQGQFTSDFTANVFGCTGANKSPELEWSNAPAGTKSFAITMYDPDAPTGSGWWHWVVFDIPAGISSLKQGAGNIALSIMPADIIQSMTDFGTTGYGGPCPPVNDKPHAYVITVYALKISKLGLDRNALPALVGFVTGQNLLAKASLIVYYRR